MNHAMRLLRLAFLVCFLTAVAQAQLSTCTFSTTINDPTTGRGLRGVKFFVEVRSGVVSGQFIQPGRLNDIETDSSGKVKFAIVRGATVTISANHPSFKTPQTIVVPAQATYDLAAIADLAAGTISPSFTNDSILFISSSVVSQDNANFTFDNAAKTLRVGPAAQRITAGPSQSVSVGKALMLIQPTLSYTSGSDFRSIGVMVKPQTFGATTGGEAIFHTSYNTVIGTSGVSIPAGTKGQMAGYEANIDTAQAYADQFTNESGHGFGATLVTRGGANLSVLDGVLYVETVATSSGAGARGLNLSLVNNVNGSLVYGAYIQQAGTQPGTAAYTVSGSWGIGFDAYGPGGNVFGTAAIRLPNNSPIVGVNQAGNAHVSMMKLNTSDQIEFGNHLVVNTANPFVQVGDWLFQRVDADGRIRFFEQAVGEPFAIYPAFYMFVANTSGAPSGTPSGGGYLYVQAGALKFKGSSGTVTTIAVP